MKRRRPACVGSALMRMVAAAAALWLGDAGHAWPRPGHWVRTGVATAQRNERNNADDGRGLESRGAGGGASGRALGAQLAARTTLVKADKVSHLPRSKRRDLFSQRAVNRAAKERAEATGVRPEYKLTFWGSMVAGAVSRSVAQTALHPANVIKTLLQTRGSFKAILPLTWGTLSRGAGAQFLLSLPNGALHFAVLEKTRQLMQAKLHPAGQSAAAVVDFASSSLATIICSVTSTPQMVLTNRIMAGVYPDLSTGVRSVWSEAGARGFYSGWWAGVVQKVPSYALTWVMFQQAKDLHFRVTRRLPTDAENFWIGCLAAAGSVTFMIPMDAVKTRLVTQTAAAAASRVPYKGILDCFVRMVREEGVGSLYNSLTPRLVSVVPMIGIQYGVYEAMKRLLADEPLLPPNVLKSQSGASEEWREGQGPPLAVQELDE